MSFVFLSRLSFEKSILFLNAEWVASANESPHYLVFDFDLCLQVEVAPHLFRKIKIDPDAMKNLYAQIYQCKQKEFEKQARYHKRFIN